MAIFNDITEGRIFYRLNDLYIYIYDVDILCENHHEKKSYIDSLHPFVNQFLLYMQTPLENVSY